MRLQDKIFKLIEEQKLLVFPNQISADSWADYYAVMNVGKAVFTDRLVSWDRFVDSCTQIPQNAEKAEAAHRLFFVSDYLKKEKLNTLCPPDYPQSRANFEDEIASALPDLPKTLEDTNLDYALKADITKLLDAYKQYLEQNNLYEKSYLVPDFSKAPEGTTLVFASALTDGGAEGLASVEAEEEDLTGKIKVFDNSLAEIRYTFEEIRKLLGSGCPGSDIKVTTASKEMYPWLEAESNRAGVPISIVKGRKLSEFNAGKLFSAVKNVISNRWSIESLQNLLLNPAFPIKDRGEFEKLISFAVEYKVVPSDGASSWLFKLGDKPLTESFVLLRDRVQAFESAKTFDALRQAIHAFEDDFLSEGQEEFKTVYTRCMEALESLISIRETAPSSSVFDFFLRLLSMTLYTPKTPSDAIAVYTYPSNAAMVAKHHFAIGFSDTDTVVQHRVPPFTDKEGLPVTDGLISAYCACGAQISCATKSYSGEVSVPSFFTDRNQTEEIKGMPSDLLADEEAMWRDNLVPNQKALPEQKKWFEKALTTSLREREVREFKSVERPLKITATALSAFVKCPFRWYCAYVLGIDETDYRADMADNLEVGNLLHDCLEQWLNEVGNLDNLKSLESRRRLDSIFIKRLEKYRHSEKAAYLPRQERILLHFPDIIYRFADADLGSGMKLKRTEEPFDTTFDGFRLKGRIDCILEDANGNYAVIDFKKKKIDKSSEQIQLYAMVMDKRPVMGAYYSIEEGKLEKIWKTPEELEAQLDELKGVMASLKKAVENSDLEPTPSDENCKDCEFRGVCRRRYVIK